MQLYVGSTDEFVGDVTGRRITDRLRVSFYEYFGHQPAFSELQSWENSLTQFALVLNAAQAWDNGIVVEMDLPSTSSRLDCLLFGVSEERRETGLLVELKQWTTADPADAEGCVETYLGKRRRVVPHPSLQSLRYAEYLEGMVEAYDGPGGIALRPCSYLHNLDETSTAKLRDDRYASILARSPLYAARETDALIETVRKTLGRGRGMVVMQRALSSKQRASRKLLEHTAAMVKGEPRYTLLDDQIVAYETVLAEYRKARRAKAERSIVVVKGGPGTGKSLIALNLIGTLSSLGVQVRHATGSKAFTETLWKVLGTKVKPLFRYFNNFGSVEPGSIEVLICDEAHRIRKSSVSRFTPKAARTGCSQIDELIGAAKTSVFFVDDHQAVRPDEIGSSHLIREAAVALHARFTEIDLTIQFRCAGSETYLEWLDQTLGIRKTGRTTLGLEEQFDFRIAASPERLEAQIRALIESGQSARITAGYCWKWSDPDDDGNLVDDIVIGSFRRPWNAKPGAAKLATGIPPAPLWAWTPTGVGQAGCIYTAQGFEFDYVGVIFGRDFVVRDGTWVGHPAESKDPAIKRKSLDTFTACVRNVYRVLLTRGLKGCIVTFLDEETQRYFEARIAV